MTYRYEFRVEDVTCEKCETRVRAALEELPGVQKIELLRTPQNEAIVVCEANQAIPSQTIEQAIEQKSSGTTHHYRVHWEKV